MGDYYPAIAEGEGKAPLAPMAGQVAWLAESRGWQAPRGHRRHRGIANSLSLHECCSPTAGWWRRDAAARAVRGGARTVSPTLTPATSIAPSLLPPLRPFACGNQPGGTLWFPDLSAAVSHVLPAPACGARGGQRRRPLLSFHAHAPPPSLSPSCAHGGPTLHTCSPVGTVLAHLAHLRRMRRTFSRW